MLPVPASAKRPARRPPTRQEPIQVNIRLSSEQVEKLDEWLEKVNEVRGWPKLTRTDMIRNLVVGGIDERPKWAEGTELMHTIEIHDAQGRILHQQPVRHVPGPELTFDHPQTGARLAARVEGVVSNAHGGTTIIYRAASLSG